MDKDVCLSSLAPKTKTDKNKPTKSNFSVVFKDGQLNGNNFGDASDFFENS